MPPQPSSAVKVGPLQVLDPGACIPGGGEVTPPFQNELDLCEYDAPATCPAGVCVPRSHEDRRCVVHEGEMACPGDWGRQQVVYERDGFIDTRACTPCTCRPTNGTLREDATLYSIHHNTNCAQGIALQEGTCEDTSFITGAPWSISFGSTNNEVSSCAPAGGGFSSGAVTPGRPLTVCCW
jgi:hypothetical protein